MRVSDAWSGPCDYSPGKQTGIYDPHDQRWHLDRPAQDFRDEAGSPGTVSQEAGVVEFVSTMKWGLVFHKSIHRNLEIIAKTALTGLERLFNVACVDG